MAAIKFIELFQKFEQSIKDIESALISLKSNAKDVDGVKGMRKEVEKLASARKKVTEAQKIENDIQKKKNKLISDSNKLADKASDRQNLKVQTTKQIIKLQQKEIDQKAKLIAEEKRYGKAHKNSILALQRKNNALVKLNKNLDVNSKQYRKNTKEIARNEKQLKKHDKQIGRNQRSVGNYGKAFQGLIGRAAGFIGIYGLIRALGGMIKIFSRFEKANKRLQAILGVSAKDIKALSKQAKELGAITAFTASQVTGLQIELAKLGFTLPQIEASTEGILALAAATGTDLAEAATLTGAAVRIFGLNAEETARVADVLALSTSKSALDMQKLATALPIVGTTAKQAGLNIEQTTALLGTLADRGIDASTAATSLRMIFLKLAAKGLTYNEAMEKINSSTNKTATAFQLFGARAATAATILSETGDATAALTEELNNAKGAAQEMADVMLDNLAGDITKAKSAWEGFVLSMEDGEGIISEALRDIVKWVTRLLTELREINEFGVITNEATRKGAKEYIDALKEQLKGENRLIKAQRIREQKQIILNKLGATGLGRFQTQEGEGFLGFKPFNVIKNAADAINATQAQRDEYSALIRTLQELNKLSGDDSFFDLETELIEENTEVTKENREEKEKLTAAEKERLKLLQEEIDLNNRLETATGTGVSPDAPQTPGLFGIGTESEIRNSAFNLGQIASGEALKIKTNFQNYLDQLFSKDSGESFLSRLFGGGENGKIIAAQAIQIYQDTVNLIGEAIDNELNRIDALLAKQDEQIKKTEDQLEAEKDRLTELKAAGAAFDTTEKQRLQKKLQREEAARQKSLELQKKAKQKQKRLDLTQAIIDTASATLSAFKSGVKINPIVGAIFAAIAAAFGALQISAISSQKFAGGTDSVQLNGASKGVDTVHAKLTEGEMVVQKNIVDQLPKGFTRFMLPEAANLYMGKRTPAYINDNTETNKYLKNIDYNTKQKKGLNADGSTAWEKKGNSTIYYN